MSEMATTCEMSPPTPLHFGQAGAILPVLSGSRAKVLGRTPKQRSATRPQWRSSPGLSTYRYPNEGATCCVTARLLLIDADVKLMPDLLRRVFPASSHEVQIAVSGEEGLEHVRNNPPDVVLLDLRLPDQSGQDVFRQIHCIDPSIPVIFVTMTRSADAAIEAMRHGAYDYLFKPLDPPHLRRVVGAALDVARRPRQQTEVAETAPDADVDGAIVGSCPGMRELYKAIGRVAAQDVQVLITGESGTGKELVARALHQHGRRAEAPFLVLNCAAIPENLLESELFGHEKGAFSGADRRRIGKFEQCHGGTLFLDEIGDMPLALQAKMLRVLQEQAFERVGGNETVRTDVRLIAATHRNLKDLSAEGKFRPDLYYRLGVFTIHVPPLRERGEDLPLLVRHYLGRFNRELGREVHVVAPESMERLRSYGWPGNIRELQSVLKQGLLQARGTTLLPAFLPDLPGKSSGALPAPTAPGGDADLKAFIDRCLASGEGDLAAATHRRVDLLLLTQVLEETGGNQAQAASLLGIARETLRRRLRELGLHVGRQVEAANRRTAGAIPASGKQIERSVAHAAL